MPIGDQIPLQLDCVGALAGQWDFIYGMLNKFVGFFWLSLCNSLPVIELSVLKEGASL